MEERVRGEGARHGSREKEVVDILFSDISLSDLFFLPFLYQIG